MKRIYSASKGVLISLLLAAVFTACFNSSSSPSTPSAPGKFSREVLCRKAYIGGSLIYNPDNASLSQLYSGVKVAVRTSKLKKESVSLMKVEDSSATISVNEKGEASGLGASETFDDYIVETPDSAVFGYISISSISKDSVSFVYSYYPKADSALVSQNCDLKLGGSAQLASNSSKIKYEMPHIARKGFENARWLTFVNSEDEMTACMFSAMPEVNGRPLSSIYGVNTDDDFIYIVGDKKDSESDFTTSMPGVSDMVSYGDYLINMNDSKIYAVAGDPSAGYSSVLKDENDFDESVAKYTYQLYQFPDAENGPKAMFEALPKSVQDRVNGALPSVSNYIDKLNWALCDKNTFTSIADDLRSKGKTQLASNIETTINDEYAKYEQVFEEYRNGQKTAEQVEAVNKEFLRIVRNFLDDLYGESPDAYIDSPTLFNVYPDIALDLGGVQGAPDDYSVSNIIPSDLDFGSSKSFEKAKNYNEYVTKRDEMIKKFKDYHQLNLAKLNGTSLEQIGINISLGVKGSVVKNLGVKSGEFGIKGLGAAIFVKAEASLQKSSTGDHSFLTDEQKEKLTKKVHEPITFAIGPVPCVFQTVFKFDFGWKANLTTNIKYMAGVTALYGGQIDLGAKWGIKFKGIIPWGGYMNTWPTNPQTVTDSVFYLGPSEAAADMPAGLDLGVYVSGTLTPMFGIGFKYISTGIQVPAEARPEVHFIIDNKFMEQYKTMQHLRGLLGLKVTFGPYFQVVIPVIDKKIKTDWTAFKILDKGTDTNPIELFDLPL